MDHVTALRLALWTKKNTPSKRQAKIATCTVYDLCALAGEDYRGFADMLPRCGMLTRSHTGTTLARN